MLRIKGSWGQICEVITFPNKYLEVIVILTIFAK